MFQNL